MVAQIDPRNRVVPETMKTAVIPRAFVRPLATIGLSELDKVNCKSTGHPITTACVDTVGWVDARGYTCSDHLQLGYCMVDEQTSASYAMADGVGAHQAYLLVPLLALRQYASRMLQITNAPTMARNAPFAHLAIGAPRACQS
jgi:hypothetical protein